MACEYGMSCHEPTWLQERQWGLELNNIRTFRFRSYKRNQYKLVEYTEKCLKRMLGYLSESKRRKAIKPQEGETGIRDWKSYTDSRQCCLCLIFASLSDLFCSAPSSYGVAFSLPHVTWFKIWPHYSTSNFFYIFTSLDVHYMRWQNKIAGDIVW